MSSGHHRTEHQETLSVIKSCCWPMRKNCEASVFIARLLSFPSGPRPLLNVCHRCRCARLSSLGTARNIMSAAISPCPLPVLPGAQLQMFVAAAGDRIAEVVTDATTRALVRIMVSVVARRSKRTMRFFMCVPAPRLCTRSSRIISTKHKEPHPRNGPPWEDVRRRTTRR